MDERPLGANCGRGGSIRLCYSDSVDVATIVISALMAAVTRVEITIIPIICSLFIYWIALPGAEHEEKQ